MALQKPQNVNWLALEGLNVPLSQLSSRSHANKDDKGDDPLSTSLRFMRMLIKVDASIVFGD